MSGALLTSLHHHLSIFPPAYRLIAGKTTLLTPFLITYKLPHHFLAIYAKNNDFVKKTIEEEMRAV